MSTATIIPFVSESNESAKAIEHYEDAYNVAQKISEFAETVKLAGIFLGGLFVVAATIAYQLVRTWHSGFPAVPLALLACALAAVLAAHAWEKIFQTQAYLLEMTVDSAVNSSPFLSNAQRAAIAFRQPSESVAGAQAKLA